MGIKLTLIFSAVLCCACGASKASQATTGTTTGQSTGASTSTTTGATSAGTTTAGTTTGTTTGSTTSPTTGTTSGTPGEAALVAKTTTIPACTIYVDAANAGTATGTVAEPYATIGAAVTAASNGAIICVAEGTYAETLAPLAKYFTLAGGFQTGSSFTVRDSSQYVSKAQGDGHNIFLAINDDNVAPGPGQLTAVDGFELTNFSQAIVRDFYESQRFDLTNNYIHDNTCDTAGTYGAGFALANVEGTISGNVVARNSCDAAGGGYVVDGSDNNAITVSNNWFDANVGSAATNDAHAGGLYLIVKTLTITNNSFTNNTTTGYGGGLYVGASTNQGQHTTAALAWNVYKDNRAGIGGGFFCDDSAHCDSNHELFIANCGGNVYVDSGSDGTLATLATFDHMTNVGALSPDCTAPGAGFVIDKGNDASDVYTVTNSIFWNNKAGADFSTSCVDGCDKVSMTVIYSLVQTTFEDNGIGPPVIFGTGNVTPADPLFVDAAGGDYHLRSTFGHWTASDYVSDATSSPALQVGDPATTVTDQPARAGTRTELGLYGSSAQASYVQ